MLLVLDNRDSFTFNLVQLLRALGVQVEVRRADSLDLEGCRRLAPERILVGPGPGRPEQAGCSLDVLRELAPRIPTLGVCLGHQAVGLLSGAKVGSAPRLLHGHTVDVHHDGRGLFTGIPSPFPAARYNSLTVLRDGLPAALEISAHDGEGDVLALRHRDWPLESVQFHPESILSEHGRELMGNFLARSAPAPVVVPGAPTAG